MKNLFSIFIFNFSFLIFNSASAQHYLGIANSAFAGVNGIDVNPASIVGSPRKWDVTIIGINAEVANNFLGITKGGRKILMSSNTGDFDNNTDLKTTRAKTISVFAGVNLMLPSFMFIRSKHKDAFAFTCRSRIYANIDGIPAELGTYAMNNGEDSTFFQQDRSAKYISAQAMVWNEYGITYGKTIRESSNERLNVAGRLKYLQGFYSAYLFTKEVNYKYFHNDSTSGDSISLESSLVHWGYSPNLSNTSQGFKLSTGGKPAFALDAGATYEFHPLTTVHTRLKSEGKTSPMQHEYKYKLGFSIQDLGWIKFRKPDNVRDFQPDFNKTVNISNIASLGDSIKAAYEIKENDKKYRMQLPTLISAQGDYYAGRNIYVNSTFNYAFQFKRWESKIHEVTCFSITPRWDWKWLGVYFPVSYNKYTAVRAGATVRIGPLIAGTADLLPLITKKNLRGADFHFMLKVPHLHFGKHTKRTKSNSKFEVNEEKNKPVKRKKGKTYMPKKDESPVEKEHKQPKPEKRKKKEHTAPEAPNEKKVRKHIFPRFHLFKKKNKHKPGEGEEHTIYFKL
ncbi:MAG: hypothetical protein HY063_06265 [Bacteroidetes bacterium]|nr:hypothetical protein [Bacteroidota bacterium]